MMQREVIRFRERVELTVDVTEPARFRLFGMMKPPGPIDGDITLVP